MLSAEENALLTRVSPGTPMGGLMRRYWIPAAFSNQIEKADGPPVRVRLLGENLVLFRDSAGNPGLLGEYCPHRTASLFYGRNEEGGLRCVYHGVKFDIHGTCLDVPCVPPGSNVKDQVRAKSYPCIERGDLVWTYMGPPEHKPAFPDLEWALVPSAQRFSTRHVQECNWLQGLEGGFDASHLSFLHSGQVDMRRGRTDHDRRIVPTKYEVMPLDFGFAVAGGRELDNGNISWHVDVMLFPFHKIIPSVPLGAHIWAPIDDENTMLYSINFHPDRPLTEADLERELEWRGIHTDNIPGTDYARANRANDYLIDRELQASGRSYTGIRGLGAQDCAMQESMGPIADRTQEFLFVGDSGIVRIRKLLLKALRDFADGKPLIGMDPAGYRVRSFRHECEPGVALGDVIRDKIRTDQVPA